MQSSPEDHTESNPVAISAAEDQLETGAQTMQSKPDEQELEDQSEAPAEATAEAPGSMVPTPPLEKESVVPSPTESCENREKLDTHSSAKSSDQPKSVAKTNASPGNDVNKEQKRGKGASDGRKFPSKKAMIDPLKMDMSKPVVTPLTSPQLSLHCIQCHIIFSDFKSKERHLKSTHPAEYEQYILRNSLFACYVCDRHFTNSVELLAHQKAHTDKRPFKCPLCNQSFKKTSELTNHKKSHFNQNGYPCSGCGKSCKTLTLLKYHQRTHSGEKPYVCKECGKRFPLSSLLHKHILSHSSEGGEGGAPAKVYLCPVCNASFRSPKSRQLHVKIRHKLDPVSNPMQTGLQVKQSMPIITPISISQPTLLQVEPNGPLQKVDANVDTENIRKLIESLGNVHKVNQVVILGQVPPHAPPLKVQQVLEPAEKVDLNLGPPQIDFIGLKPTESKLVELDASVSPLEQTIILEPITPEGTPENPSFSDLGSQVVAGEPLELKFVQAEQTEKLTGETHLNLHQSQMNPMNTDPGVCMNEGTDLKQDLEQTVILELIPAAELEQSQIEPQNEVGSSSFVQSSEQEIPDQAAGNTAGEPEETDMPIPPLTPTVESELPSPHPEKEDLSSCPSDPPETITQEPSNSETTLQENTNSREEKVDSGQSPVSNEKPKEKEEQDACEKDPVEEKRSSSEDPAAKEETPSKSEAKEDQRTSELPVSVMSAQELVKVRKRKPARTFFFQGYMHDLVGSIYRDDFLIDAKPAKRQRTKKSCVVVKFGSQGKDKKSKKQKAKQEHKPIQESSPKSKTSPKKLSEKVQKVQIQKKPEQEPQPIHDSSKTPPKKSPEKVQKVQTPKKTGKGKKEKTENMASGMDMKLPEPQSTHTKQVKEVPKKNKMKKQKESKGETEHVGEQNAETQPMLKKKKAANVLPKGQPKSPKGKKTLSKAQKVKKAEATDSNINQDSLLLLKGHKQPQLKVYKLDTSKPSGPTPEGSVKDSQSTDDVTARGKKKGTKKQKSINCLSLLSSLKGPRQQPEIVPSKPKTTRKRKAPLNVETEGVITSKRALECKDCGEKFSEVASLQKHKTTAHIIESPGLTYTNGNIFEGVSGFDLYRLPKEHGGVVRVMNAPTDWDTEPEMGDMSLEDRDRGVSFPALIPSPSLQIPPQDVEMSTHEHRNESKTGTEVHLGTSCTPECFSRDTKQIAIAETSFPNLTETRTSETVQPVASDEKMQEDPNKNLSNGSRVQGMTDEDVKEDFLLEVDLVTIGEQEEKEEPILLNEPNSVQMTKSGFADKDCEQGRNETRRTCPTPQTVSCATYCLDVKEEEEEMLVQKRKEAVMGQIRKEGLLNRDLTTKANSGKEQEQGPDECQIVYEKPPLFSDLETVDHEVSTKKQTGPKLKTKGTPSATSLPSGHAVVEESSQEAIALEPSSNVKDAIIDGGLEGEEERESDQSPGIILERFPTSGRGATADSVTDLATRRSSQPQALGGIADNGVQVPRGQEIKVEENSSDPLLVLPTCQSRQNSCGPPKHQQGIRSILVKEERNSVVNDTQSVQESRHMKWNEEPVSCKDINMRLKENEETTKDCCKTPDFNSNPCIFYPVKEEVREVLLSATQTHTRTSTPDGSGDSNPTDHKSTDCNAHDRRSSPQSNQESEVACLPSEQSVSDLTDGQAASDSEWQTRSDLCDFLLQSSDDEDTGSLELSEPQLNKEAEILAYFNQNQSRIKKLSPRPSSVGLPDSPGPQPVPCDDSRIEKAIDYFCEYFSWDTWVEIANYTNKLSKNQNLVTCREVARFIGIHIAMGTLKFPSARLYWDDLTKLPLIAEAMPLNRFLELSRMLKLCSSNDTKGPNTAQELGGTHQSSESLGSDHSGAGCSADPISLQTPVDPLWKVRPLLYRFNAGCRSLRQQGDYAVDQYTVALTGKVNESSPSLHCTTLIGLNGLITHVDLELDLSEKQDSVEKMIPKGSTVFLCKQELSTPAMLEHLLAAGIHGAGRVEGERGQVGDEFVSSDGKLMLRRTQCGFLLSTAGKGQRDMVSLIDGFEKAQMKARLSRDLLNLYSSPLTVSSPSCWPQAVLWHLIDAALVNSWLLYRQDHRAASAPLTLMAFRLEVSKALILSSGSDTQDSIPPQPPGENAHHATSETPSPVLLNESPLPEAATRYDGSGHWPEQLSEGEGGRCRFGGCQRTSRVLCLKCCVFLCISRNHNCFLNFHNQESVGEEH
ncbi:PREDICTED: uncharacterized protein LOC107091659 isoform X1 [Cyprinodon variegatus]|uniref:uncharacterized protein LOC107091659 isoform X1 n=1 Tax=Cyprinodon variegatus TaxID=28743 RepID=UPI0007425AF4|nr:PREDICTED: uncharacterized protein LOC107091659 isoform X1 [Cyprinodon variegatus]